MYGNIISSNIDIQRKEIFRKDFIMIFSIKNIGIIKSADVKMDGLTVISGANNSGKTTVGKALYSIVSATEDLKEKQDIDQAEAIYNRIRKIADVFSHLMRAYDRRSLFFSFDMETAKDIVEEIWYIKNEDYRGQNNFAYYKVLLYEFYEKIVTDEFLDLALKDIKDKKGLSLELQRKIKIEWKGNIDEESLLVLDEPESHLHPRWINALAEVLVLLVKECNITVLLTTHSPNFLLAIDALMRKYDIRKNCHFYQTEKLEDDFRVQYVEKTDDLDEVYAEYARAFSQMNAMRKKYMASEES